MDLPLLSLSRPQPERADAVRNRLRLLCTAREMIDELGADQVTMDALAERAGLGKGTVFRRFGSRAGLFAALIDEGERTLQQQMLSGPPPLGPGAPVKDRLIAYGEARIAFLLDHLDLARASMEAPASQAAIPGATSRTHLRMLLKQADLDIADREVLSLQLLAALEAPVLYYVLTPDSTAPTHQTRTRLTNGWRTLITHLF